MFEKIFGLAERAVVALEKIADTNEKAVTFCKKTSAMAVAIVEKAAEDEDDQEIAEIVRQLDSEIQKL